MNNNLSTARDFESAFKKYRTGMQIILEGAQAETGQGVGLGSVACRYPSMRAPRPVGPWT